MIDSNKLLNYVQWKDFIETGYIIKYFSTIVR